MTAIAPVKLLLGKVIYYFHAPIYAQHSLFTTWGKHGQ